MILLILYGVVPHANCGVGYRILGLEEKEKMELL